MGNTPKGIPYPEGGDPPAGHTQMRALAETVDALIIPAAGSSFGVLTPRAGWADYGTSYAGLFVTSYGRLCTINAAFKPTTNTPVQGGTGYNIADVPAAYWPPVNVSAAGTVNTASGTAPTVCRTVISPAGLVTFVPSANGTINTAGGLVIVEITYRTATP